VNPLVQVLQRIPKQDITALRSAIHVAAPYYRYYRMNKSMHTIPTAQHMLPDGGALTALAFALQQRKERGVTRIRDDCLQERQRKHRYINRYHCDVDKGDSLIRRRSR